MSFHGCDLSTIGQVLGRSQNNSQSVLIAVESITLLTDVESCIVNFHGLLKLLIFLVLLNHLLHMTLILLVFSLMNLDSIKI